MAVAVASCSSNEGASEGSLPIKSSRAVGATRGPHGERAIPTSALDLSPAEVAKVRSGHYTAALVWHEESDFTTAVTAGVRDVFDQLGIRLVAQTSANFDPAKQKSDLETVEAKKPSVLLSLPIDPVITASAYKAIAGQGTKVVLLSIVPQGMRPGRDYVDMITDDLFEMGKRAADALAAAVGDKGKVGYFFRDANSFVANQRDQAFLKTITANYPNVKVVARQGIADPNRSEELANAALTKNPDLDGVYVTFSEPPGEGVLAALHSTGNTKTKVVSLDLSEPMALDMAKGGPTFALIADRTYELGRAMATSAGYGLIGKRAPPFLVAPALTITKSNLVQGYRASLHRAPPASVTKALGQ